MQARITSKEGDLLAEKQAQAVVEDARRALSDALQARDGSNGSPPAVDPQRLTVRAVASSIRELRKNGAPARSLGPLDSINDALKRAAMGVLEAVLLAGVKERPVEGDDFLETNYAPVPELGLPYGPLQCIQGAIPADFPAGTYIRNGPNPFFHPVERVTRMGTSGYHWFEGDGMLHAVSISERAEVSYTNRHVHTTGLAEEKRRGKPLFWGSFDADTLPLVAGMMLNAMQFGHPSKLTANVNVIAHHGKLLALHEADAPYEMTLPDLKTVGRYTFGGALKTNMTSHPKIDPITGNLHYFNYSATVPYCQVGVVSPSGQIIHRAPVDVGRATFMHDFAITRNYCVLLDFPLTIDPKRLFSSGSLIEFEKGGVTRIGVMPKFGGPDSVRWFGIKPGFAFHVMNAYEDGDEVVVHGTRQTNPVLKPPKGITWGEYLLEKIKPPEGEMLTHLYEWRLDLATGKSSEQQLVPPGLTSEFPRINDQYCGLKYKYGYSVLPDVATYEGVGVPLYTEIGKFHVPDGPPAIGSNAYITVEHHRLGPKRYGGEPTFVARPGSVEEDDGWVVLFVYDEPTGSSEFYAIDARDFEGPPVARVRLPQRVPYGLHGAFVPAGAVTPWPDI